MKFGFAVQLRSFSVIAGNRSKKKEMMDEAMPGSNQNVKEHPSIALGKPATKAYKI